MNEIKFFCLPNLATDDVTVLENPWDVRVPEEILNLPKEQYKARWRNPETRHWLLLMAEGRCPTSVVTVNNEAAVLYGFMADYDGVLTDDMIDVLKKKYQSRYCPRYWCKSQSGKLHLIWFFERPIAVTGNAHANELLRIVARKIKAVRWGVGYDPSCENVTQVLDIGREWHVFRENAFIPSEEIVLWDFALFEKSAKSVANEVIDMPLDVAIGEIRKRKWPIEPPADLRIGTRCTRFWDAAADNASAAQLTKDGFRVYTPHDGGFKGWKSLLGSEFCEQYTAKSVAPFAEDTYYCHAKDEYWRFFRNDVPMHYEKRTEKVLRRDIIREVGLSPKPAKGESLSEIDVMLYNISRKNAVDSVAPILYREGGRIEVRGLGTILNTSLVAVKTPAPRVNVVTPEDLARFPLCPEEYRADPSTCAWDNPFAVERFPHIHHLLTGFFMNGQKAYDRWEASGFPLHGADGAPVRQLLDVQLMHLLSWMAHFYKHAARMSRNPGRGQALILAGPAGVGKSFIGRYLLGNLMGGAVDAEKFYLEGSRFNSGIVSSPIHLIDDKLGSRSQRIRLQFTEALKIVVANAVLRYEAKFGSAVESVPWPGRIVVLANEDAQSLSVLPDLDMSTRDKFMMLKAGGAMFHWGRDDENMKWLNDELPYFARFLLSWTIPLEIRDERFGVKAMQHREMAQASAENGLTQILLEVLVNKLEDAYGGKDDADPSDRTGWAFEGNAVKMFNWLTENDKSVIREIVDSRTLNQNLSILHNNGEYGIAYDGKTWKIPYALCKKSSETPLTPPTEV